MIEISHQLHGYEELRSMLRALPEETRIKALKPSTREMGRFLLGAAIMLSPYRTGALRRNIRLLQKKMRAQWLSVYGLRVKTKRALTRRMGFLEGTGKGENIAGDKDPWYWFFQEFGTVHHDAHPFLRPALENNQQELIAAFREAFKGRLEKAVRMLARTRLRAAARGLSQ